MCQRGLFNQILEKLAFDIMTDLEWKQETQRENEYA